MGSRPYCACAGSECAPFASKGCIDFGGLLDAIDQAILVGLMRAPDYILVRLRSARTTWRGITVHVAARVAALAGPSECLVTRTVRDLVAGADIRFIDRGRRDLKGLAEAVDLFAATPRQAAQSATQDA